jgi:hypothetical protein
MTDRPTLAELLDAVRQHLDSSIIPAVRHEPKLYFQTLVASNLLRIAERELELETTLRESRRIAVSQSLNQDIILSPDPVTADKTLSIQEAALCEAIRQGDYDGDTWVILYQSVNEIINTQLMINNPALLRRYSEEDQTMQFPR